MKSIIPILIVISIMLLAACSKTPPPVAPVGSGSWTFKGNNYTATSCDTFAGIYVTATNASSYTAGTNTVSMVSVYFNTAVPASSGKYIVPNTPGTGGTGAASVSVSINGPNSTITYWSTGGNGADTVSVTGSGTMVTITGSNIMMKNAASPYDSALMTFGITPGD